MITPLVENRFANRDLSVFTPNRTKPRLRWYDFKEGFSSALVDEAIQSVQRHQGAPVRVLDPFAGSGTTLITAASGGHHATGVEVNPFLAFTSAAKCFSGRWNRRSFEGIVRALCFEGPHEVRSPLEDYSTFSQRDGASKWLFNRSVLRGFAAIDSKLSRRLRVYAPVRLALLAATMECANARPDGKCLRYRRTWREDARSSKELRAALEPRLQMVFDDLEDAPLPADGVRVVCGDARRVLKRLRQPYDVLVTSPPYLNSFDYSDVYRPEMFLGGFVTDTTQLREVRLRTIRSHVQVKWETPKTVASGMLVPILRELHLRTDLWSRRLPMMVQAYFEDMRTVLESGRRLVREGGECWLVVSTSAYGGVEIPVDLIIADIAACVGWRLCAVNVLRPLRAAGQHWEHLTPGARPPLRESLIVLKRA